MKKKSAKKKTVAKKKVSARKYGKSLTWKQWGKEFEAAKRSKPLSFNFIHAPLSRIKRTGISGDPFSMVGNEETVIMKPIPFEKSYLGTQMGYKEPLTRGELGKAPAHYSNGKYTPWEIVDDWKLEYYCGNALKYICRHKHKGTPVQDIQKAIDCMIKYKTNLEKEIK
jgi:hypothetical protein